MSSNELLKSLYNYIQEKPVVILIIATFCVYLMRENYKETESNVSIENIENNTGVDGDKDKEKNEPSNNNTICRKSSLSKILWFYAPWCGHCTTFKPEWDKFVSKNKKNKFTLEKINGDDNPEMCKKYNIIGYPTVVFVMKDGTYKHYKGNRNSESLIKFCI